MTPKQALEKAHSVAEAARSAYYREHVACPTCGGTKLRSTYVGFFDAARPEAYRDENTVGCRCGWRGVWHDLVSASEG